MRPERQQWGDSGRFVDQRAGLRRISLFGHPSLAQTLDLPVETVEYAWIAVRIGDLCRERLPRRDGRESRGRDGEETLERPMGPPPYDRSGQAPQCKR